MRGSSGIVAVSCTGVVFVVGGTVERMVWKLESHAGVGPRVPIEDTCIMICGDDSTLFER